MYAAIDSLGITLEQMRRNPNRESLSGIEAMATTFGNDERLLVQASKQHVASMESAEAFSVLLCSNVCCRGLSRYE